MTLTPELMLAVGVLFASVAFATGYVTLEVLRRKAPGRQRLHAAGEVSVLTADVPLAVGELDPRLARANRFLPKSPKDMSRLQRRLARVGFRGPMAPIIFTLCQLLLPTLLALTCVYFLGATQGFFIGALLALMGYMLPDFWLGRQAEKRKKLIANGLPDALDLLIVCVEAGMGLDQALTKAAEELILPHPALAEEMGIITTEVRAGKPRIEAFKNFAERTKVDDVRQLVTMLVQTDRFGTSISQALRIQAEVSRTKRRQRAEEKAQKLGVKLVFPLVFCLFPAMFVVTLGPAVIKFVRFFAANQM
jgi:tight adherence protein C